MKESILYKKTGSEVKCNTCGRRCTIPEGLFGFCKVRRNIKGKLYALNYGKAAALQIDPIEKKPFFHFAPGSPMQVLLQLSSVNGMEENIWE